MTQEVSAPPPAPKPGANWVGPVLLLLCGTLWGITYPLSKIGIEGGIPPFAYGLWAAALSAAAFLLLLRLRRTRLPMSLVHIRLYLVTGLLGHALPNIGYYFYIPHMPAGLAAVIMTTGPVITFVLALLLSMERFDPLRALGVGCGFSGALMLVLPASALPGPDALPWVLLAFTTPLLYACSTIAMARLRPKDLGAPAMAAGMFLFSTLAQIPAVTIAGEWRMLLPPSEPHEWALFAQVGCTTAAFLIYLAMMPRMGPVYMSQTGYIVTLASIIWGLAFFGETLSPWVYGAAAIILCGVALVNLGGRRKPAVPLPEPAKSEAG